MFSSNPGSLGRVRSLLNRLEQIKGLNCDADTIEAIKCLLHDHILALETLEAQASDGGGASED
jgi:hypothetical protein